ncbi:MAG: maturase [Chloroflexi bacterium]|nr:maturase [Chloroflexota bacterium]
MRDAETILAVIRERGKRGLPLERIYRLLFNRELYLRAYGKIARNRGALTPGATTETVDGMSLVKIDAITEALRFERYQWTPVRRVYIEKKGSTRKRPLGLPTWSDKLLQEVIRMVLEAYYEPQFSDHSHGFRAGRGCHTALTVVHETWTGTAWFIEGDIAQCYDRLDHQVLLDTLSKKLHDNRFLRLIGGLLEAGYLEDWKFNATLSGVPQGGIVSPVLSNIYLDRLDKFVETVLLPAFNQSDRRRGNRPYKAQIAKAAYWKGKGDKVRARQLRRQAQTLPSRDPDDPTYRRLHYVRYADDFLLGFNGPRVEAEAIKQKLGTFLREELKLDLSESKTLITHARTEVAHFLGYAVNVEHDDHKLDRHDRRSINGAVQLRVPEAVIRAKCTPYLQRGKSAPRRERSHDSVFSIVARYQSEYRGIVQYYQLATNLAAFNRLHWIMEGSLTKTLSLKLRVRVRQVYKRYQTTVQTENGRLKALQVVVRRDEGKAPLIAQWGGISLARRRHMVDSLDDQPALVRNGRTEIVQRLLADACELCGSQDHVQVHHIRALKHLRHKGQTPKSKWVEYMATRQRKTLVVCRACHTDIHHGRLHRYGSNEDKTLESRMIGNGQVRFGGGSTEKARASGTSLAAYPTYIRATDASNGERLPAFGVQLAPPPESSAHVAARLARHSAESYGRDALDVELDLQSALERVRGPRAPEPERTEEAPPPPPAPDTGMPAASASVAGAALPSGDASVSAEAT